MWFKCGGGTFCILGNSFSILFSYFSCILITVYFDLIFITLQNTLLIIFSPNFHNYLNFFKRTQIEYFENRITTATIF